MGIADSDRTVKNLFRGMFRHADRRLACRLERQGRPELARKIREKLRRFPSDSDGS